MSLYALWNSAGGKTATYSKYPTENNKHKKDVWNIPWKLGERIMVISESEKLKTMEPLVLQQKLLAVL